MKDVENNLEDIMVPTIKKNKKIVGRKKIPANVPTTPVDNVSSPSKESVLKWKFVYHRRIVPERELSKEALKCEEIVEVLEDAQIIKIVSNIRPFYPELVKEFIINIPKKFNNAGSKDFEKVHV